MGKFVDDLFSCLEEQGFRLRIVSVSHLHQLEQEIESLHIRGLFDSQFYQERLVRFSFQTPKDLPNVQSLIVVAVPRPQTWAIFTWNRQKYSLILPPTYTAYDDTTKQVQNLIAKILSEKGYKSVGTALPLKLLTTRSSLVRYGRNNIAYSPGLGNFFQLVAAYSDIPCEVDFWQEATMMKSCEECELCRKACPTCAISFIRFLLHAELCITYHNEKKGNVLFPKWMKVSWHNCTVGCMRCQKVCPQNKEVIQWVEEEEEFSEEETNLLLENVHDNKLPRLRWGK